MSFIISSDTIIKGQTIIGNPPSSIWNGVSGAVAIYDALSYTSGNTWLDSSGNNRNITLTNPVYTSGASPYFTAGSSTLFSIPGSTGIYTSNFTWCMRIRFTGAGSGDLGGLWWSEISTKNFLIAFYSGYWNNPNIFVPRIDTPSQVYASWSANNGVTNQGPSPALCTADYTQSTPAAMLSVRKTGTLFEWFINNQIIWTLTISNWNILNNTQAIYLLNRAQGSYYVAGRLANVYMYGRSLSNAELAEVELNTRRNL